MTTLSFRALEFFLGYDVYGKTIDMWVVGRLFAEMVKGESLFGIIGRSDSKLDKIHKKFMYNISQFIFRNVCLHPKSCKRFVSIH